MNSMSCPGKVDVAISFARQEKSDVASAGQGRLEHLFEHMPMAMWEIDASSAWKAFCRLKANGISNLASYIDSDPRWFDQALDTVMILRGNETALELLGERRGVRYPRPVRSMFRTAPDVAKRLAIAYFEGRRTHIEDARVDTLDGRVVDVLLLATFPELPGGMDTIFFAMVEITDRIVAQAQLRQVQADLAHAARVSTLGELTTSIAHEVKQPLASIVMNGNTSLRWLANDVPNLSKVRLLIERIVESASQATDIISRIQAMAARRIPVWTDISVNDVADASLRFVHHESMARDIVIRTCLADDLPSVAGDRIQLQQVMVNLLVNAIQAIDHWAFAVAREIILTSRRTEDHVELVVEDTGPGIAPENLERLFTGFFTTKADGMGMGLSICRTILRGHGGDISAANRAQGGALFSCRVPVV